MLEKIVLLVVGAVAGGIGTLVMRWLRKDRVTEEIKRRESTTNLIATMRERGVSMAQIDAALAWIEPRGSPRGPMSPEERIEEREYVEIAGAQSQADMNEAQYRRLTRLERRMGAALENLKDSLENGGKQLLTQSQAAWEAYRDSMAEFAGAPWSNGTMRPFIEAGVQSHLTKQRAADLERELAHHTAERGLG